MDVSELARTADLPGAGRPCTTSWPTSSRSAAASPARGLRETLGPDRRARAPRAHRGADGDDGPRLDDPEGVERPRRLGGRRARAERVIDFQQSNLHVVNYSVPVRRRLTLDELRPHLHTLPDHPTWIPYRTSYYAESWGFCLSQDELDALPEGEYEVVVDATLDDGSLTYGECVLPGASERRDPDLEPRLPSIPRQRQPLRRRRRRLPRPGAGSGRPALHVPVPVRSRARSARSPGWRATRTCCDADPGRARRWPASVTPGRWSTSAAGGATPRSTAPPRTSSAHRGRGDEVVDFSPYGYDERQFCSPGFDLPVGAITRSGHDRSVRHHTSADDLASIDPGALADTLGTCLSILGILEDDATLVSRNPKGEPQLGPARPLPSVRRSGRAGGARVGAALGDEPGRRRAHDRSTSPSGPACRSRVVPEARGRSFERGGPRAPRSIAANRGAPAHEGGPVLRGPWDAACVSTRARSPSRWSRSATGRSSGT